VPRYLSKAELEKIADRVFRAYLDLPEVRSSGRVLRVVPELLLSALLGLSVEYRQLSPDGSVLGMTSYEEVGVELPGTEGELYFLDGETVLIETFLLDPSQTGRRNFTLVHEGCHHVLKLLFPRDYGSVPSARRVLRYRGLSDSSSREEWQVERLTASVLMPRALVEQAMFLSGQEGRIGMLNALWRPREYERFCDMCVLLGVSRQALSIRMKELGLLGESYLGRPNAILDVMMEDDEIV
jgi:hypothetical protein